MAIKRAEAQAIQAQATKAQAIQAQVNDELSKDVEASDPSFVSPPLQEDTQTNQFSPSVQQSSAQHFSIADLAKEFDTTARTLRHYEAEGLITPARKGQSRIYSNTDRVRLGWIMRGKRVGFSLAEIKDMLALYELDDGRETQRKVTLEKCYVRLRDLEAQRTDLDTVIAELSSFCETLENVLRDPKTGRWVDPETGRPPTRDHLAATGAKSKAQKSPSPEQQTKS